MDPNCLLQVLQPARALITAKQPSAQIVEVTGPVRGAGRRRLYRLPMDPNCLLQIFQPARALIASPQPSAQVVEETGPVRGAKKRSLYRFPNRL